MNKITNLTLLIFIIISLVSCRETDQKQAPLCDGNTQSQKVKKLIPKGSLEKLDFDSTGMPYVSKQYVLTYLSSFEMKIEQMKREYKNDEKQLTTWIIGELKPDIQKHFTYNKEPLTQEQLDKIRFDFCECDKYALITLPVDAQPHGTVVVNGQSTEGINRNYIAIADDETGQAATLPSKATSPLPDMAEGIEEKAENDIVVGIEDTGYDYELMKVNNSYLYKSLVQSTTCTPNDIYGWNLVGRNGLNHPDQDSDIWDNDPSRHGTLIAENIIRMNQDLKLKTSFKVLPVKSHDENKISYLFHIMCGIRYAADKGARILNASYRFYHTNPEQLYDLKNAIAYAKTKNMLIITSAGNDGCTMNDKMKVLPAQFYDNKSLDNIVVVTSINKDYATIPAYANRNSSFVHIAAQGTTISKLQTYKFINKGTSYATGIVSGYATYLLSSQPSSNLTYLALRNNLLNGSHITNVSALFPDVEEGRVLHYWLPDTP